MVKVICKGGLGNQLFQIAFGANQALRQEKPLTLLISESTMIHGGFLGMKFAEALSEHLPVSHQSLGRVSNVFFESSDRELMQIPEGDYCFDGYWQGRGYHQEYSSLIYNSFNSVLEKSCANLNMDFCVIHRRLGDYLVPVNRLKHGVLAESYFEAAKKHIGMDKKFVWSTDSPDLLSNDELLIDSFYESLNDPIEVMAALSGFSSIITSNSSFSWWSAVLRREKKVVQPSSWLRESSPLDQRMKIVNSIIVKAEFI